MKGNAVKKYTQKTEISQYILACILGTLAIVAGGISLAMNVAFGAKTGIVMAAIFALSDGAKIILPMVNAALGGVSIKRKAAYSLAVVISIAAATSYLLEMQTARIREIQHREQARSGAERDIARIRKELSKITEPLGVPALQALVAAKGAAAQREANRGSCGPICEKLREEQAALTARLGQATRRGKLETMLKVKIDQLERIPAAALGSADTIAALTGINKELAAQREGMLKAILMLVILEMLAMFSGDAGTLFIATYRARKAAKPKDPAPDKKPAEPTPAKTKRPGRKARISPEAAFEVLRAKAIDGTIVGSNTSIARMLNVPVPTVGDINKGWLTQWEAEGKIKIEVRKRGRTVLKVAA
jgi:hypothetical protein